MFYGEELFAHLPEHIYPSYLTALQYNTDTNCEEWASCVDIENIGKRWHVAVEVWMATGGRGQWVKSPIPVTGLWDERRKKGLLEAVPIAPLFTLTPGLWEARVGHMPNSPGGQSCLALSLTSLPAPLSPVRYMSVYSHDCISGSGTPLLFSYISCLDTGVFAFEKHCLKCHLVSC